MEKNLTLTDALAILRRRWFLMLLPMALGLPLVLSVAFMLPATYESSAQIIVESQQIPGDLARSTVAQSAAERIQFIRQRLLTRDTLLEVAAQHGVFPEDTPLSTSEQVAVMRQSTRIAGTGGVARRGGQTTATGVSISFRASDPAMAARVANEFVSRILEENAQARINRATGTLTFFDAEVARLSAALDEQGARIAAFKQNNADALPENQSMRQSELVTLRDRRFSRENQRVRLEEELQQLEDRLARGEPEAPRTPAEQELAQLRQQLVLQRAMLAETHPTIRRLNARVAALEATVEPIAVAAEDGFGPRRLTSRIETLRTQLRLLDEQVVVDENRLAYLEETLAQAPAIALALGALQREMSSLQTQYREAVLKRAQAELGERLEASQQAERFEVIEQAVPATEPIAPNRPRIIAAGGAAALAIGMGLIMLAEVLNRALRTARDVERQLELAPIVSIPYIPSAREDRLRRLRFIGLLALCALTVAAALYAVDQFYMPLPRLFERLMDMLTLDNILAQIKRRFG